MTEMERIARQNLELGVLERDDKMLHGANFVTYANHLAALREFGELALRHINAMKQRKAVSRDRAKDAGREMVAECRQSDVETCEELEVAIRKLMEHSKEG